MRSLQDIAHEEASMHTIADLTNVFEGIASLRISQIKNQVQRAQDFFQELWHIYTQLRVDSLFRFGRDTTAAKPIDKELFIIITAEGGFSGDIDERLISQMLSKYDPKVNDIIVIGHHGAILLAQKGVSFKKYFKMPVSDQDINVTPLVKEVQQYRNSSVFYQKYVSLMSQDVQQIDLSIAVKEQGKTAGKGEEIISERNYIFEPSTFAVVGHLERSMVNIMLGQVILESKLAQYASRFRAMTMAHKKADETVGDLHWTYNRVKRSLKDERLKEIINGLRKAGRT